MGHTHGNKLQQGWMTIEHVLSKLSRRSAAVPHRAKRKHSSASTATTTAITTAITTARGGVRLIHGAELSLRWRWRCVATAGNTNIDRASVFNAQNLLRSESSHRWLGLSTPSPTRSQGSRAMTSTGGGGDGIARRNTAIIGAAPRNQNDSQIDHSNISGEVVLTDVEMKIFETLLQTCKFHNLNTTLRVAGGWVRDKVLGLSSDDIDIALDDSMGHPFAKRVHEYLVSNNDNKNDKESHSSIGVIKSNPEQSKHLETATMRLCGQWIDFVNLRTETYAADGMNNGNGSHETDTVGKGSRIPESASFGSPSEDAYRRDLTINALFYNIHTGCVEDYTGMGLQDLRDGIIRTPLIDSPKSTFLDDPLRVLRAVRFAARFRFELAAEVGVAMRDKAVLIALEKKVSRERIGTELDGMIKGPDAARAIRMLEEHDVLHVMLGVNRFLECSSNSSSTKTASLESNDCEKSAISSKGALKVNSLSHIIRSLHSSSSTTPMSEALTPECRRACYIATLLLETMPYTYQGEGKNKKKRLHLSQGVILESLKLSRRDAETVLAVHESLFEMLRLLCTLSKNQNLALQYTHLREMFPPDAKLAKTDTNNNNNNNNNSESISLSHGTARRDVGMLIRNLKETWIVSLIICPLLVKNNDARDCTNSSSDDDAMHKDWVEAIGDFYLAVVGSGLANAWQMKPFLTGKEIMSIFEMKTGGPVLGIATTRLMEWQLENPQATKDECVSWLNTSLRKELEI